MAEMRVVQPVPRYWTIRYNTADTAGEPEVIQYKHRKSMGVVASDTALVLQMAKERSLIVHQLNHGGEIAVICATKPDTEYSYWSVETRLCAPHGRHTCVIGIVAASIHDAVYLAKKHYDTLDKGHKVEILAANKRGTVHTIIFDQFVNACQIG